MQPITGSTCVFSCACVCVQISTGQIAKNTSFLLVLSPGWHISTSVCDHLRPLFVGQTNVRCLYQHWQLLVSIERHLKTSMFRVRFRKVSSLEEFILGNIILSMLEDLVFIIYSQRLPECSLHSGVRSYTLPR